MSERSIRVKRIFRQLNRLTRDELAELRQEINLRLGIQDTPPVDVSNDDFELYKAGTGAALRKAIEQRDRYKMMVGQYEVALNQVSAGYDEREKATYNQYAEQIKAIEQDHGQHNAPITALWIQSAYMGVEKDTTGKLNKLATTILKRGGVTPVEAMVHTAGKAYLVGVRETTLQALKSFRAIENNPYNICFEITWELIQYDKVILQTVSRLDMEWIKQNVSDRIGSHNTLWQAINTACQFERSGETLIEFATGKGNTSPDNLRKYKSYLDKIREYAKQASIAPYGGL